VLGGGGAWGGGFVDGDFDAAGAGVDGQDDFGGSHDRDGVIDNLKDTVEHRKELLLPF